MTDAERKVVLQQYKVTIDGSEPSEEFTDAIVEVLVDERLNTPTMFEIRLHDPEFKFADGNLIKEGKVVEVFGGVQTDISIGCGEIASIEGAFQQGETQTIVRGYDKSFRLQRGIKHRSFLQMTDSDIVRKIAGEAGLSVMTDTTTVQHPYVLQYNETDFAFLQRRAARLGYEVAVDQQKLIFRKPPENGSEVASLTHGDTLTWFRPQRSIGEQINEVTVRGWDPKTKQAIVGQATSATNLNTVGDGKTGGAAAKPVFGDTKRIVVDSPVDNKGEADALAMALLNDLNAEFVRAEGETFAQPKIRVGKPVKIEKVGQRFGGTYYVTAVTHRFGKEFGHKVEFAASTRSPSPLAGLMPQPEERHRVEGVVIGVVTNNKDTNNEYPGHVKVKFPWFADQDESHWARLAPPMAGPDRGFLTVPEVNDEVLVAFEHGDPHRPFVLGALWNGVDKPPVSLTSKTVDQIVGGDGKVNQRFWRSRSGHLFEFDDTQGEEQITIIDKTGKNYIKIISKENKLEVQMEGDIQVTSKTGKIDVKANKDISFESETGKVSIKAKTDFVVQADANASMKAQVNFDIAAQANATMKANANLDIAANAAATFKANAKMDVTSTGPLKLSSSAPAELSTPAMLTLSGTAMTKVEGGMVNVNGTGMVNVSAPLVKLN